MGPFVLALAAVVLAAWPAHGLYFAFRASRASPLARPPSLPELPPITCVIPAANEEATIRDKIANLREAYPPDRLRVIVVLNNSTDATRAICENLGVTLIHSPAGKLNALEAGRRAAETEFVLATDCDVHLRPDTVERLVAHLANAPSRVCVVSPSHVFAFDRPAARLAQESNAHQRSLARICRLQGEAASSALVLGPCHMYRKSAFPAYPVRAAEDEVSVAIEIATAGLRAITDPEAETSQPCSASARATVLRLTRGAGRQIHTCITHLGTPFEAKPRLFGWFIFPFFLLLPRCGLPVATLGVALLPFVAGLSPLPVYLGAGGLYLLLALARPFLAIQVAAVHLGWLYALLPGRRGAAWHRSRRARTGQRRDPRSPSAGGFARTARLLASHLVHPGDTPFHCIHFVTHRCNLRCRHCFIHGEIGAEERSRWSLDRELTLAEIEALTRSLNGRLGMVSLTGGEPFLRSDLLPIALAYTENAGATIVQVPTNGSLPDRLELFAEGFLERTAARLLVWVSFDGLSGTHDRGRGMPGAFEAACGAVRRLRAMAHPRLATNATITVCDQSTEELVDLGAFLFDELGVDAVATAAVRGAPAAGGAVGLNLEGYRRLNALVRARSLASPPRLTGRRGRDGLAEAVRIASRRLAERTLVEGRFLAPCTAGRALVNIQADGRVTPCELLGWGMGDLRDWGMDLTALLASPGARAIRRRVRSGRCFCSFECAWVSNVVFEPRNWGRLLSDYARLSLGR